MGSCVSSLHKNPDSAMKFRLGLRSKNDKIVIPTHVSDKSLEGADAAVKSQWSTAPTVMASRDFGSKEEAFFDSQPWLESDCEDDFFSVNGDFTPSRGNTPVHHSFSAGVPGGNRSPFLGRNSKFMPELSPADKKKKLSDLFKESAADDEDDVKEQKNAGGILEGSNSKAPMTTVQVPPKSRDDSTPFVSGVNSVCSNSERSPNAVLKPQGEKSLRSVQCCLPRLLSSRSFSERKKKTSPAPSVVRV